MPKRLSQWLDKKKRKDDIPTVANNQQPATTAPPPTNSTSEAITTLVKPRDLWEAAFNNFNLDDQHVLRSTSCDSELPGILDGIVEETKAQYETYKSGGWKVKISHGQSINIRESAFKVINAALSFKDVIGAAVAFDPTGHASSAWSIVSIGLRTTKNHHEALLAVLLRTPDGDFRMLSSSSSCVCVPCGISVRDCWLAIGVNNVLWLPPDYRPTY